MILKLHRRSASARFGSQWSLCVSVAGTLGLLGGCGGIIRDAAGTAGWAAGQAAPQGVVQSLADVAGSDERQRQLELVARSPGVQQTSRAVGNGLGRGIVDELVNTAESATTQPAVMDKATAVARQHVAPIVTEIVGSSAREVLKTADSADARAVVHDVSEQVGDGVVRGAARAARELTPQIAAEIREQLGPAVREALRGIIHELLESEVAPVAEKLLDHGLTQALAIPVRPEMQPVVVQNAHNLSLGGGWGTHDFLLQTGVISQSGGLTGTAKFFVWGAATVVGLVGVAAAVSIVVLLLVAVRLVRRKAETA